jgi:hypothetical protein
VVFLNTLFYPVFLGQKWGVFFDLDWDCIFNRSSVFVPEEPKGEFVGLLLA